MSKQKEQAYDEHISPLMVQVIALCKEHRINMAAQFGLDVGDDDSEHEGNVLYCTTVLHDVDPDCEESAERMQKLMSGAVMHGLSTDDEIIYWRDRTKTAEDERDSLCAKLAAAERERDSLEARIVTLIDAAHSGPVDVPNDVSHEVARVVNAVRVNVTMRERTERERANEIRHPMAPDRCPQCNWTNVRLMNYGESVHGISESIWLCHGCAAKRIRERDEARAELASFNGILSKTNEALNRAGCHSALYYWEHIDSIAKERDEARGLAEVRGREVARLTEECEAFATPIDILTKRIERDTAEAIAAWLSGPQPMRGAPTAIVTGPLDKIVKSSLEQAAKSVRAGAWRTKGKP